jgi:hypothetical protein
LLSPECIRLQSRGRRPLFNGEEEMSQQPPTPPPTPPPGFYPYPPQQPPKKKHTARTVLITLSAVFVVLVGAIAGCSALFISGASNDSGHTQINSSDDGGTRGRAARKAQKPATKQTHDPTKYGWWYDSKKDVAVDGIATDDVGHHVTYTVHNQSNKMLDYDITFALYDANGTRVGEAYGMPTNVAPGETVKVTDDTEGYFDQSNVVKATLLTVDSEQSS